MARATLQPAARYQTVGARGHVPRVCLNAFVAVVESATLWGLIATLAGLAVPLLVLWCRQLALRHRVTAERRPTEAERALVHRRGRYSVAAFVLFWPVALGLVLLATLGQASAGIHGAVALVIVLLAAASVTLQLTTRCPICRYRLGYQQALGTPARCERCGASLGRLGHDRDVGDVREAR